MGGHGMSEVLEYHTDLDEVLKDRIKKIEDNVGKTGLVRLFDRILGEGHKVAVTTMRDRYHLHGTGETEKFEIVRDTDLSGRVSAISKVVGYLEWGTPTPILPKNGEFLYFENLQGQLIRVRSVKGIEAQHNLRDQVLPAEDRMIRKEVDEAVAKAVA
jgi:hypothetical protein